jgi:hypothetical protein
MLELVRLEASVTVDDWTVELSSPNSLLWVTSAEVEYCKEYMSVPLVIATSDEVALEIRTLFEDCTELLST